MRHSTTVTGDPDTHDDFKPTNKLAGSGLSTQDIVEQVIRNCLPYDCCKIRPCDNFFLVIPHS